MTPITTVLITGSKSGIGRALLEAYSARDSHLVIAAIRDGPNTDKAKELEAIPTGPNSKIVVVKYDASSEDVVKDMVSSLRSAHNLTALDIVIANAGILKQWGPAREASSEDMVEHFTVHALGALQLYQATAPLLDKSTQTPKFFIISSGLGSNALLDSYGKMQLISYNTAKAAVNYIAGKIHQEEERLVVLPIAPGWIATDMGSRAAVFAGMEASDPPVKLEESIKGLLGVFDKATKEDYSGKFWDQNHEQVPW